MSILAANPPQSRDPTPGGDADAPRVARDGGVVRLRGDWITPRAAEGMAALAAALGGRGGPVRALDLSGVRRLDANTLHLLRCAAGEAVLEGLSRDHTFLLDVVDDVPAEIPLDRTRHPIPEFLEATGAAVVGQGREFVQVLSFQGAITLLLGSLVLRPWRLRFTAFVVQLERIGLSALPIVGLLAFLIGVVTAYQGADQLARFGAEIFTVDIVGIGMLREMGVLITAIIVAGRSGSAFAAELGTMTVNQEIDAIKTIGMDPHAVLVVPRVLAAVVALPLLTFYANIVGIFGGAVMATLALDISFQQFIAQFHASVPLNALWVGLSKAPVFGYAIALIGCFHGLAAARSADAVGMRTTKAVVEGIFLVIVLDAGFSVLFSILGI